VDVGVIVIGEQRAVAERRDIVVNGNDVIMCDRIVVDAGDLEIDGLGVRGVIDRIGYREQRLYGDSLPRAQSVVELEGNVVPDSNPTGGGGQKLYSLDSGVSASVLNEEIDKCCVLSVAIYVAEIARQSVIAGRECNIGRVLKLMSTSCSKCLSGLGLGAGSVKENTVGSVTGLVIVMVMVVSSLGDQSATESCRASDRYGVSENVGWRCRCLAA
jgi:hypothetical protein